MVASLACYKIKKLDMENNIEDICDLHLENTFGFKVNYSKDKTMAIAILTEQLKSKDDEFFINLEVEGVFEIEGMTNSEQKKEVHITCYDELFPYTSQIMTQLCLNSGISGFVLKKIPLNIDEVQFGDKPKENTDDKITLFPTD